MSTAIVTAIVVAAILQNEIFSLSLLTVFAVYGLYKLCEVVAQNDFEF